MVRWDYSPEILQTCMLTILKHSKHNRITKYIQQNFMPLKSTTWGLLVKTPSNYYLVQDKVVNDDAVKIPRYVALTLLDFNKQTYWIGPYAFTNNFELTKEGQYLIKMLEYPKLSEAADRKVKGILETYKYWVQQDTEYLNILQKVSTDTEPHATEPRDVEGD